MTAAPYERALRCTRCPRWELVAELPYPHLNPHEYVCSTCLLATMKLAYGELPWGY